MKKYYVDEELKNEVDFWDLLSDAIEVEVDENLDEIIDEENDDVKIGSLTYSPSLVLERCDPIAYHCYGDDIKNSYYEDDKYFLLRGEEVERDGTTFRIEEEEDEEA